MHNPGFKFKLSHPLTALTFNVTIFLSSVGEEIKHGFHWEMWVSPQESCLSGVHFDGDPYNAKSLMEGLLLTPGA